MWKLALDCAARAYKNGVNRQRMVFTFPMLQDGVTVDPMLSPNSTFRTAFPVD